MATIAEEESRTISHNITWSHQKKFEKGVYVGSGRIYGYDIKNGFKIIPKEAVVVKRIYNSYLNGKTLNNIKTELETDHVPSPKGKDKWFINTKAIYCYKKHTKVMYCAKEK